MSIIHQHLIFIGAYFSLIIGIGQLLQKDKQPASYIYGISFISMALWIFHICSYSTGLFDNVYIINLLLVPAAFISAPAMGLRYHWLLGRTMPEKKTIFIFLIPAILSFIIIALPLFDGSLILKSEYFRSTPIFSAGFSALPGYFKLIQILYFLPKLYLVIFMFFVIIRMSDIWREKRDNKTVVSRAGYIFAVNILLSTALTGAGDLFSTGLIAWSVLYVNGTFISVYLFGQRNPDYNRVIKTEFIKRHYIKSKIRDLDLETILGELHRIMEEEKAFASEDISLKAVAEELGITPHQLSEIINKKFRKNFNTFINDYRIEEAKKMLQDEPERTITSIAMAVGFNTNTAFSAVFSKSEGMSPKQYRKRFMA
ncbi:MAG TPA: helix-turn-helix domain-containing protein [Spirochaetota bacterium]|nr:helix-turn-helix domain-containing protein [Spirochaetota bacterium]